MEGVPESPECLQMPAINLFRHRAYISPRVSLISLFWLGLVFLSIGVTSFIITHDIKEYQLRYDDKCPKQGLCTVTFDIKEDMSGNIAFLYKLRGFYQNHRVVIDSKNYDQLKGKYLTSDQLSSCRPAIFTNTTVGEEGLNLPCGLLPMSFFNDSYYFDEPIESTLSDVNISLESDRNRIFSQLSPEYTEGNRWLDDFTDFPGGQTNEHFIVWMRPAAMPSFMKLYSKCKDCRIPKGQYKVHIRINYPQSMFKGRRYLVISETRLLGNGSRFLSSLYVSVGGVSLVSSIIFTIQALLCPREFGNMSGVWTNNNSFNSMPQKRHRRHTESSS